MEGTWKFSGGIPQYLVVDNFPAAVSGADALHPRLTRGFITDPSRVRNPRNKPREEWGNRYVRDRFFKGGKFRGLVHLRDEAASWYRDVAGQRIHGSTWRKPFQVLEDEERQALSTWDGVR